MNKESGFTLLEILIVLAIVSVFMMLVTPTTVKMIEKKQEKKFIEVFEHDLLLLQSSSMLSKDHLKLIIKKDTYEISSEFHDYKIVRSFPKGWVLDKRIFSNIGFTSGGRVRNSMRLPFHVNGVRKKCFYIFPLGAGRGYFYEP